MRIIYAGKVHPNDSGGEEIIQRICRSIGELGSEVKLVYLENYDMNLARILTAGVDVWVNTPLAPMEASGTWG